MEWTDTGIVLSARRHGESGAILQLLTRDHGRHAGLVRGGAGSRARGLYQPGNEVGAVWRARLSEHLGTYVCELTRGRAAGFLSDPLRLAALSAACAVAEAALPEREPCLPVHDGLLALFDALEAGGDAGGEAAGKGMAAADWPVAYVRWELALLSTLGFGLDLAACAATGREDGLAFVSPRTGRAVSAEAGAAWRDRLLPLPAFLTGAAVGVDRGEIVGRADRGEIVGRADRGEIADGLRLTGYFLDRHVFAPEDRALPAARQRLVDRLA